MYAVLFHSRAVSRDKLLSFPTCVRVSVCVSLHRCVASGAQIVLSRLAIGDLATQYFADRGVFCAGRVESADMERVAKATGARMQTTVNKLDTAVLGTCAQFEERQVRGM